MSSMSGHPQFLISSISSSEMAFENGPFTVSLLFMCATPPKVSNTHKQNLYHMKALDEEHVMAPLVMISSISSSEMASEICRFTVSLLFMRATPPRVSYAYKQNLYHIKALDE